LNDEVDLGVFYRVGNDDALTMQQLGEQSLALVASPLLQDADFLRRLGCEVTEGQDEWKAVAPTWRFDMEIEEDLVEEVARVYG
ncbi:hypothetical protein MJI69_31425, partial [Salmonella enterica subsp. enterica serovar Anatum]|nr:hypothetical protein [Salmonella enterica subsp. enterica serovar Anatum]